MVRAHDFVMDFGGLDFVLKIGNHYDNLTTFLVLQCIYLFKYDLLNSMGVEIIVE